MICGILAPISQLTRPSLFTVASHSHSSNLYYDTTDVLPDTESIVTIKTHRLLILRRGAVERRLILWSQTQPHLIPDHQNRPRWGRSLCGWRGGWGCSWIRRPWESCWSWASPSHWQTPSSLPRPSGPACCPIMDGFCKCCPAADIGVVTVRLENLFP